MGSITYDPLDEVEDEKMEKVRGKYKLFGRIAFGRHMDTIVHNATSSGGVAYRDEEAETIEVYYDDDKDELMLRAMHKGDTVWVVMYSTEFYSEDM